MSIIILDMAPEPKTNWVKACEHLANEWRMKINPYPIKIDDLKTMADYGLLRWASYQDSDLNQVIARNYTRRSHCLCWNELDKIHPPFRELVIQAYDHAGRVKCRVMNAVCLCQREIWDPPDGSHCPHYNIIRYVFTLEDAWKDPTFQKYKQWFQDLLSKLSEQGQGKLLKTQITIWRIFDPYEMVYKEGMGRLDVKGLGEEDTAIILNETLPTHSLSTTIEGPITFLDNARLKRSNKPFYISARDLKKCSDVKLLHLAALGNACTNKKIARLSPRKIPCICSSITLCMLPNEPFDWAKRVLDDDMNAICHLMVNSLPPNARSVLCPHRNIMMLEYSNGSILNDSIPGFWLELDQFQAYKYRLNKILRHLSKEGQNIVCHHPCKFWLVWDSMNEEMILLWDNSKIEGLGADDTDYIKNLVPHPIKGMMNTWWTKLFPSDLKRWQKAEICGQKTISRADVSLKDPIDEMEEILKNL